MAKNIDLEVKSKKTEKNWGAGPKDPNKNRHTIELAANHIYDPDNDNSDANEHAGTSLSLNTTNDKVADSYNVGDKHTLSLKKKSK
jgi:hypothetical protein